MVCISWRWIGLITASLELNCINYFGGKNTFFACFTVGYNNFGVEFLVYNRAAVCSSEGLNIL